MFVQSLASLRVVEGAVLHEELESAAVKARQGKANVDHF